MNNIYVIVYTQYEDFGTYATNNMYGGTHLIAAEDRIDAINIFESLRLLSKDGDIIDAADIATITNCTTGNVEYNRFG